MAGSFLSRFPPASSSRRTPYYPTPYTLRPTPFTLHPTPYALHPTPYTLHPSPHTLHPTSYTLRPTPYSPHPSPYTLHPTPCTLHPTLYTPHHRALAFARVCIQLQTSIFPQNVPPVPYRKKCKATFARTNFTVGARLADLSCRCPSHHTLYMLWA